MIVPLSGAPCALNSIYPAVLAPATYAALYRGTLSVKNGLFLRQLWLPVRCGWGRDPANK